MKVNVTVQGASLSVVNNEGNEVFGYKLENASTTVDVLGLIESVQQLKDAIDPPAVLEVAIAIFGFGQVDEGALYDEAVAMARAEGVELNLAA